MTAKWMLALLAAGLSASPAAARTDASAALQASSPVAAVGRAQPLPAWNVFCRTYARECATDEREPAQVELTQRVWQLLVSVNRRVNHTLDPLTDEEHWGVPDRWDLAEDGAGDCEDFQLVKRRMLAEAGLPRRALRMTVVVDEKGEGHAVLMVRTDRGDFVLDNKHNAVLPWHRTGYVFIKRESHEGQSWVSLGGAVSPSTTANP